MRQLPEGAIRLAFLSIAGLHLALGTWMVVSPHTFFTSIGAFEAYNPHYERDTATFYLAFGCGAAVAAKRPSWRVPVLTLFTLQYVLHAGNHLFDVGRANNRWAGVFDVVSLSLAALQFGVLLRLLTRREGAA